MEKLKRRLLKILREDDYLKKIYMIQFLRDDGFEDGRINSLHVYTRELKNSSEEDVKRKINGYIKKYWQLDDSVKVDDKLKERLSRILDKDNYFGKIYMIQFLRHGGFEDGRINSLHEYTRELKRNSEGDVMKRINNYIKEYWGFEGE